MVSLKSAALSLIVLVGTTSIYSSAFTVHPHQHALLSPTTTTRTNTKLFMGWGPLLKDYSVTAAGLFNNVRTPAALICSSIVPLGLITAPEIDKSKDSKRVQLFKKVNLLLAIASLLSEILAITFSTVAINKLAEVKFPRTTGVNDLLSQHFEMAWMGTNVHFLLGMFGFGLLVGSKAYFTYGSKVGKISGCWGVAVLLHCSSIVNQGTLGTLDNSPHFASNVLTSVIRYVTLALSRASSHPLSMIAFGVILISLFLSIEMVAESFGFFQKEKDN